MEEEPVLVGIDVGSLLTGLEWRGPSSGGGGRKQIRFPLFREARNQINNSYGNGVQFVTRDYYD